MKFILSIGFSLLLTSLFGQWKENFQTGIDNSWTGDRSHFIVNANQQLQLSAPVAGSSILLHPFVNADSLVWMFYFKLEFAPSASNKINIILMTDRLMQDSANAYLMEIGENGNNDNWKFYVQQSQSKILYAEGELTRLASDPAQARMKIQKNRDDSWTFSTDYSGGSQIILEKSVQSVPSLNISNPLFGIQCFYTDTRKDKFYLDDVSIDFPVLDLKAPEIIGVHVISEYKLRIQFDESVDSVSSLVLKNYQLDGHLFPISAKRISTDQLELGFSEKFVTSKSYQLRYDSIADLNNNLTRNQLFIFLSELLSSPGFLDMIITEIMADPTPVVGLPEKEFVEIKNISAHTLDLTDCTITDGSTESKLTKYVLDSNAYLILCNIKDTLEFKPFGSVLGLSSFPSLNNSGDLISLRNKDAEIINEVNYEDSWYRSSIKKEGGYTLELINTGSPCAGKENWTGSQHFSGGTPGYANSGGVYQKDVSGPELLDAYPLNEFEIKMIFDEKLDQSSLSGFSIMPTRSIASVDILMPSGNEVLLVLNEALEKGIQYKMTMNGIRDCVGNISNLESNAFALPAEPIYRDLVWSEVLFNPYSGGVDFIELYNRSNKVLSLNKLLVRNQASNANWYSITSDKIVLPGNYVALTSNPEQVFHKYWHSDSTKIIQTQIPSIDDDGGNLELAFNQNNNLVLLDSFTFSKEWHHPFIHDVEGVSLEKIDMEGFSNNRNNWQSAAASFGYATPGIANSHFIDTAMHNMDKPYTLSSTVITPNGDSYRDFLSIQFHLNKSGYKSKIEIFDLSGQKLKSLSYQVLSAQDLIVWNGDDDASALLPVGNYILYIELVHPDGDLQEFKERVVVDR